MKKPISTFLFFVMVLVFFTETALAAPSAMSYFSSEKYNKTYTGDDGFHHTMSVKWVGETWNKVGTVIYSINYEDVYQKDNGDTYIDVKSATEIFNNACPTYPDSPQHSVYQVKWYPDGHKNVISDYRTAAAPEPTKVTQTENPTVAPTQKPITTPSSTAAEKTSKPVANTEVTTKPSQTQSGAPINSAISTSTIPLSPTPSEETATVLSSPSPTDSDAQGIASTENSPTSPTKWVWFVIAFSGISVAILLALFLIKRRKEKKRNEDREA